MGPLCTKQSQKPMNYSPIIDSPSYLLGNTNPSNPGEKISYDFDTNQLNFIPDSDQQWDVPLILPTLNPTQPILERSNSFTHIDYSINMSNHQKYKCDQCGMIFPSNESLFKHKTRFCIGVKDSGIGRQPVYSDDEELDNHSKRSTIRKVVRHQSPIEKKREEINDWKQQRSILQTVKDMEDRILTDSFRTQKLTNNNKNQDNIYNEILVEYERLQSQERDILCQMYNIQIEPTSTYSNTKLKSSIDLNDQQKDQLEELQRKNFRLERERRVIQKKLEELISINYQPTNISNYEPYRFLRDMKEQHELNEKALEFLRGRLSYHDNNSLTSFSDIPTLPYVNNRYNRLRRTDSNPVRNFRNNYLQTGGHDANVIARYSDIEYRLRAYEDYPWTKDYPEPLKQNRLELSEQQTIDPKTERLKLANEENLRLQNELHEMHKKFDTLNNRTRQLELSIVNNGMPNSIDHQRHTTTKIDPPSPPSVRDNNHQTSLPVFDKRVISRASPAMSLLASNMSKLRDPLAPQSYDPIGGFVIFFDFVASLPSTIDQFSLVTCLYHPKSGLGEPSQLEPFKCEQYIDEKNNERMSVALIATKQPVPRCPPQQALTVVIEAQTLFPTDAELRTTSWTKLPLFDNKNRLLSGRWKVPLKSVPIQHSESLAIISTLPSYERAELYYRLVNSQDAEDQSHAPLSPSFRDLYTYPLQYRI